MSDSEDDNISLEKEESDDDINLEKEESEDNNISLEKEESEDDNTSLEKEESDNEIVPEDQEQKIVTWKDLGLVDSLCQACKELKYDRPFPIQIKAIPIALQGRDIIGLAETGSGKTATFALPILQALLENPQRYFALILTPTRELAMQISETFEALGSSIGVQCAVIVGGLDMVTQALRLAKKPHIIIATPGRLLDHLEKTKGFNLKPIKYLVMDEADRMLNADFEVEVSKILKVIPRERRTFLFSATMTSKVNKLQRASLRDPETIEVSTKYETAAFLKQYYIFIPLKNKDVYLIHILNELVGKSFMIFCNTCDNTVRLALFLRTLGMSAIPLSGKMAQNKRIAALNKFKSKNRKILIATDVASRGIDIPHVDVVLNYDIPTHSKDYTHRVGRTARAGRAGTSITFVTQYDVELYQRIEQLQNKKLPEYKCNDQDVMALQERVSEAQRTVRLELKEIAENKGSKKRRKGGDVFSDDDTEESAVVRKRLKFKGSGRGGGGASRGKKRRN